ncbi:MAG: putative rhamnosyl transferase [Marinibacterium sp.]
MQVIGLCRFSYAGEGGFQVEHDTIEERESYLFDPARLETRLRTFECFTLPSLKAQTDPDFTLAIVTGTGLPGPARARLEALAADLPQARILVCPPGPHRRVMQGAINSIRRGKGPSLQFRMDDDDAVSVHFVERLRAAARDVRPLLHRVRHVAIDFNRGYVARPGPDGIAAAPINRPLTTAALALMIRPDIPLTVMNFSHTKLGRHMPVLTMPDDDMLVRGDTTFNDSRQKPSVKPIPLTLLDAVGESRFREAFNIDANHVRRLHQSI